jgi:segregation and condensation protein A
MEDDIMGVLDPQVRSGGVKTGSLPLVNGEPLKELPPDLYIPPDALAVYLNTFEGPLDLLSWLIRRHRLDVLDIPMAQLTEQYMKYVLWMRSQRLELAAEYLVMAVWLIEIKSRLLLPGVPEVDETAEGIDPRAELVQRLLEYEQIRWLSQQLEALPRVGREIFVAHLVPEPGTASLPVVDVAAFPLIWLEFMQRDRLLIHHKAARQELSVRAAMARLLSCVQGDLFMAFHALFDARHGVAQTVVNFLALLELARERQIEITQQQAFAPIYLRAMDEAGERSSF